MKTKKLTFVFISCVLVIFALGSSVFAQGGVNGSGWWSSVNVQRVGDAVVGSIDVYMDAYSPQGETTSWQCGTRPLAAKGSGGTFIPHWASDPSGDNCADVSGFPTNFEGSSVLNAADDIVAVSQMQNISFGGWAPGDSPYGRAVAAYSGIGEPSDIVKFPLYKYNHQGETSTFFIQNAGGSGANIVATFKPCANQGNGTPCLGYPNTYTYSFNGLDANRMIVIDASMALNGGSPMLSGNGAFGALTVEATNDVVLAGVVLEHKTSASPATMLKSTRGFGMDDLDTTIHVPAIKYLYPRGTSATSPNQAKWSGLTVHNADTIQASVNITYTLTQRDGSPTHPDVGDQYYQSATIQPSESAVFLFFNESWANPAAGTLPGDLLSAEIDGNGRLLAAIVNEEGNFRLAGGSPDYDFATYSVMPHLKRSTSIAIPFYKEQYRGKFHGVVVQNVGTAADYVNATITVIDSLHAGIADGQVVKVRSAVPVQPGGSVVLYMTCQYSADWVDQAGDDKQKDDLCSAGSNPTLGTNNSVLLESTQPLVALANEELLWYVNRASVADAHGEDASSFEGFPLVLLP